MATYTETAWGSTSSGYPSSILTKRWVTTNETSVQTVSDSEAEDGYLFEQEWSVAGRRLNSLDAIDTDTTRDDIELLCRFRLENRTRQDYEFGLVGRASGSAGSETGYVCFLVESTTDDLIIRIVKYNSGTGTTLGSSSEFGINVDDEWWYLRFRINGANLKAKVWGEQFNEPSTWQIETTDSSITAAGWGGLWGYAAATLTDIDYLSIGTDGDTAPLTADPNTAVRLTSATASALYTAPTAPIRVTSVSANVLYRIRPYNYHSSNLEKRRRVLKPLLTR